MLPKTNNKPLKSITMQTKLTTKAIAQIGEEIGVELGTQMVKGYQQANPSDVHSYLIGRNIIDQILAQPGCVGIKFYNAYNEAGEKTLVYVGVDATGAALMSYSVVTEFGQLEDQKGIVADRVRTGGPVSRPSTSITEDQDWYQVD